MPFIDSLDIANRACQHLGATRIANPSEDSVNNSEMSFAYDKLRRAELRRNTWTFAKKKAVLRPIDSNTYLLSPAQWNSGTQYLPGSVVADANGQLWVSNAANNIGNDPNLTDVWDGYFGSMSVDNYDTTGQTSYFAGDLVWVRNSDSSYVVYMSMQNANTEVPNTADAFDNTITYQQDAMVSYGGSQWRSLIAVNLGNTPSQGAANWIATKTYSLGNLVTGSDGYFYTSFGNGNLGNNPTLDSGTNWVRFPTANAWSAVPKMPVSSSLWTPLYASLTSFNFVYPIGSGPASQSLTKNVFRLPAGFLRKAPQDPKAGLYSWLGAPAYNSQNDWEIQGDFLISSVGTPIIFTFIADIMRVKDMDDLFCECLAARMGLETCETITNSTSKQQTCNNAYKFFRAEAIVVNSILAGPTDPAEDDYINCRL